MAHKNLVDGTAYDTKGGRCLVDGTGYDVKKGRTLVGGTGFDIVFSSTVAVNITNKPNAQRYDIYAKATIGGTVYTGAATTEVKSGDTITFYVKTDNVKFDGIIVIDGTQYKTSGKRSLTMDWTVPYGISEMTINITYYPSSTGKYFGKITVTTS